MRQKLGVRFWRRFCTRSKVAVSPCASCPHCVKVFLETGGAPNAYVTPKQTEEMNRLRQRWQTTWPKNVGSGLYQRLQTRCESQTQAIERLKCLRKLRPGSPTSATCATVWNPSLHVCHPPGMSSSGKFTCRKAETRVAIFHAIVDFERRRNFGTARAGCLGNCRGGCLRRSRARRARLFCRCICKCCGYRWQRRGSYS